jgi:hypothetical protein
MAWMEGGTERDAADSTAGSFANASARSLFLPLRLTAGRRSLKTGMERLTTGLTWRRNGARSLVERFAVATRGSRSSRVGRRLAKVVLAWRRAGGRALRARSNATFSSAIAPRNWLPLETRPERSSRRSATAVTTRAPSTSQSLKTCWSRFSSWISRSVAVSAGERYL